MKHLISMTVVIGIVGLLVAPGLARDPRHSGQEFYGHSARWQYVEIEFVHDTFFDVLLWPDPSNRNVMDEIPGSGQLCQAVHVPGAELSGDVEGYNVLLSDLLCISADFTKARVEATGFIISDDREIYMKGDMVLNINPVTGEMKGFWRLKKGFGTHHGVLYVEGTSTPYQREGVWYYLGEGTYSGWIRENRY